MKPSPPQASTVLVGSATIFVAVLLAITVLSVLRLPKLTSQDASAHRGRPWGRWGHHGLPLLKGDATHDAVSRWARFWGHSGPQGSLLPEPEGLASLPAEPALRPAGDTVFMRYRGLWTHVEPSVRHRFRVAALTSNSHHKLALLGSLAQDHNQQVRFRALLEIARVHLRNRAFDAAERTAHAALALPGIEPRITADAYFVLGFAMFERREFQRAEQALAQAVDRDPGFWDARRTHLAVLSHQLEQRHQSPADCLNRTRRLIEHVSAMPLLAQDRTQFRDLADAFAQSSPRPNPAFTLVASLGYLWSGDRERARTALATTQQSQGTLPRQCEALIGGQIETLRAQLSE